MTKPKRKSPVDGTADLLITQLRPVIKEYYEKLWQFPHFKNAPIENIPIFASAPALDSLRALNTLFSRAEHPFERFASAKFGLKLFLQTEQAIDSSNFLPGWIRACNNVGAYDECIHFTDELLKSEVWQPFQVHKEGLSILLCRAKALRNLGRFEESLTTYREAIVNADQMGEQAEVSIGLLFIGKLYGNYLGQRSLFSSFVEEAKARLQFALVNSDEASPEKTRLIRYLAICHDSLGQAYREDNSIKAENHFIQAIELNKGIKRWNGISRSLCHLNHFRFQNASLSKRALYLEQFKKGLKLLLKHPPDEYGLGIRFVQYATMLQSLEKLDLAKEYLTAGKNFAIKYSVYRTLARAAIVESELYSGNNYEKAMSALEEGSRITHRYGLLIYESIINRLLAESMTQEAANRSDFGRRAIELFERNREIFVALVNEVRSTLTQLDLADSPSVEFARLSESTRRSFRENLLLDYEHIVKQLSLNISALTTTLRSNERRREELLALGVVNSVARALAHEVKLAIPGDTKLSPYQSIADKLDAIDDCLERISKDSIDAPYNQDLNIIRDAINNQAVQVRALGKKMGRLKTLLAEKLRHSPALNDKVSLQWACKRAIAEFEQHNQAASKYIEFYAYCDIIVTFDKGLMVTMILNLLYNAFEAVVVSRNKNTIVLSLRTEATGDTSIGNEALEGVLSILCQVETNADALGIADSIRRPSQSKKPYRSGVGMSLASIFFDLLRATVRPIAKGTSAGLEVFFPTGTGRAEIIMERAE